MSQETEIVLGQRQMRRRLSLWRGLAVVGFAIAVGALVFGSNDVSRLVAGSHIARVAIEGTIMEDRQQLEMLRKIADDDNVKGMILFVNSPGGTTAGGEALFEELRKIAEKKPLVAQFGTVAASAGYIVGLATDHIVARGNTITGSVGVIVQWPEVSSLLDKLGVKMNEIKSGELKATPSPFQPADVAGLKVMQDMIDEGYRWFSGLVEARRGIRIVDVPGLGQGRVFSGREALSHKLVDAIGGEPEARRWLEDTKGVEKDLKIIDWKPAEESAWGVTASIPDVARGLLGEGAGRLAELATRNRGLGTLGLDGMLSVWHPSEN
ncbi:MAG: signal peptide peptidase SppA [Hyphomicrobium sp.]|nr:signal peptide peptidase SppA [Hyphomicrobium sp.]